MEIVFHQGMFHLVMSRLNMCSENPWNLHYQRVQFVWF